MVIIILLFSTVTASIITLLSLAIFEACTLIRRKRKEGR